MEAILAAQQAQIQTLIALNKELLEELRQARAREGGAPRRSADDGEALVLPTPCVADAASTKRRRSSVDSACDEPLAGAEGHARPGRASSRAAGSLEALVSSSPGVLSLFSTREAGVLRAVGKAMLRTVAAHPWCDLETPVRERAMTEALKDWARCFPAATGVCLQNPEMSPPQVAILGSQLQHLSALRIVGYRPRSAYSSASQLFVLKRDLKSLGSFILGDTDTAHSRVVVSPTYKEAWSALGALRELDLRVLHSCVPADLLTHLRSLRRIRLALQLTERRPAPDWQEHQRRQPEYIAMPPFVVSDGDVAGLSSSLVELSIDGRVEGGFDAFAGFTGAGLARLTGLASLALVHCALPVGVFHALPASVRSLDISGVRGLTPASFDAMPHPADLRTLRLDGGTTGIGAAAFARLSGLAELHVGSHDTLCCDALLFALARHGSLRVLTSSPPPAKQLRPQRDARAAAPPPPQSRLSPAGWAALLSSCPMERLDLSDDNAAGLLIAMSSEERLYGRGDLPDESDEEASEGGAAVGAPADALAAPKAPLRVQLSCLAVHAPAKPVGHAAYRFQASSTLQSFASAPFSGLSSLTLSRAVLPRHPGLFEPLASTLVALDVRGCSGLCDTAFAPLVALRSLDISACKELSVHVLRSLPPGLTSLRLDSAPPAFTVDDKLLAKLGLPSWAPRARSSRACRSGARASTSSRRGRRGTSGGGLRSSSP